MLLLLLLLPLFVPCPAADLRGASVEKHEARWLLHRAISISRTQHDDGGGPTYSSSISPMA